MPKANAPNQRNERLLVGGWALVRPYSRQIEPYMMKPPGDCFDSVSKCAKRRQRRRIDASPTAGMRGNCGWD